MRFGVVYWNWDKFSVISEARQKARSCKLLSTSESITVCSPSKLLGGLRGFLETRFCEHYTRSGIEIK